MDERQGRAPESIAVSRRDSLAGRLRRAFSVVLLGITATALVSAGVFGYVFLRARPEEHRFLLAGQEARLAHSAMVDQETGIRGYLLSGERLYLAPYLTGTRELRTEETRLVRDVGGDQGLAHLVIDRRVAEQAWFDQWATPAVQGQPITDHAQLDAFVATGKSLFDAYRAKHAVLTTAVDRRRDDAINAEGFALGTGAALEFVVLLATALVARRQSRR
ncbi:MAG: CHASE3 domain-containing protein, partial [Acidimicrobiia bacterium]|nr:CHASE3 domain-containing protein [Acidimicrobiia bacterium]